MRDHLDEVAERQPLQHRAAQGDLPAVLEHAHLAPVLGLVRRRRLLERLRRRLVDRAPAGLHHPVREREVVPPLRVDLDVVRAPHGVDRAVAAGDRAEPRLRLALHHLVAPVDALLVRAVRGLEHEPAADVGDVRVGEVRDELAQRVGRPGRVRVREGDDLAAGLAHGPVLRRHLAAARVDDQPHAVAEPLDELVRAVGRRVRGDDERRACRPGSRARAGSRAAARSRAPRCRRRRSPSRAARSPPCGRAGSARARARRLRAGRRTCVQRSATSESQKRILSTSTGRV